MIKLQRAWQLSAGCCWWSRTACVCCLSCSLWMICTEQQHARESFHRWN